MSNSEVEELKKLIRELQLRLDNQENRKDDRNDISNNRTDDKDENKKEDSKGKDGSNATPGNDNKDSNKNDDLKTKNNELKDGNKEEVPNLNQTSVTPLIPHIPLHAASFGSLFSAVLHQQQKDSLYAIGQQLETSIRNNRGLVTAHVPTSSPKVSFNQHLRIKYVDTIPRFFDIVTQGKPMETFTCLQQHEPQYLKSSYEKFSFGILESRVILKSVGIEPEIDFKTIRGESGGRDELSAIISNKATGSVATGESRIRYVLAICQALFLMSIGCRVVIRRRNDKIYSASDRTSTDLVGELGMIRRRYIDQDMALLPAAGYLNRANYLYDELKNLFAPESHRMCIGELGFKAIVSNKATFTQYGCFTDQWFAAGNSLYLDDLRARRTDLDTYRSMHETLTFEGVSIQVESPTAFSYSIVPLWRREECDGVFLIYILQRAQQIKFFNGLVNLLQSTNLLRFRARNEIDKTYQGSRLSKMVDSQLIQLIGMITSNLNDVDFYQALAADMMTTWMDFEIRVTLLRNDDVGSLFKIFCVLLWYKMFPALAVDNSEFLMYQLFSSLNVLVPEITGRYLRAYNYARYRGNGENMIKRYSRAQVISGEVVFSLYTQEITNQHQLFQDLQVVITTRRGETVASRDGMGNQTPRIRDIRHYYQPWGFEGYLTPPELDDPDGVPPNQFANDFSEICRIITWIAETYKASYSAGISKVSFGRSTTKASDIQTLFSPSPIDDFVDLGHRFHCEIFRLRELGQNSSFVLDDTFIGGLEPRRLRPQLYGLANEPNNFRPYAMQRARVDIQFELPILCWLSMSGIEHLDVIKAPVATEMVEIMRGIQEEGILCGDILDFVKKFKYEAPGQFRRDMMGISDQITTLRSSEIFSHLSKIAGEDFKELFHIMINQTAVFVDNKALAFRIYLSPYEQMANPVDDNNNPAYGRDLILARELSVRLYNIFSGIFVPETSPINLFTRGLFVHFNYIERLDPAESFDVETYINREDVILLGWSNNLVTNRLTGSRTADEQVFQYVTPNGDVYAYCYNDVWRMPNFVLVVSNSTGMISNRCLKFLMPFFKNKKISFLLPDLVVIVDRINTELNVVQDYDLDRQFEEILTKSPSRRVTLSMYSTMTRPYHLRTETDKEKWFYLISAIAQVDLLLSGLEDEVNMTAALKIGKWYAWAFGIDGDKIEFQPGERLEGNNDNEDARRVLSKLDLGVVNFNNVVDLCEFDDIFKMPIVIQEDSGMAHLFQALG